MRNLFLLGIASTLVACGGDLNDPDGDASSVEAGADGDVDGDIDGDIDGDADMDSDNGDADGDAPLPTTCGFTYDQDFAAAARSMPVDLDVNYSGGPRDGVDWIAHAEPAPPGLTRGVRKDPDDPDLVMPEYTDTMPLFERAEAWEPGGHRCYETPRGVELLTEAEAFEMYRVIAEETTGVAVDTSVGVRSVVGVRGAYPGTFAWHGNRPDFFNDTLVLIWIDEDGQERVREFPVNTDVGARDFGANSSSSLRPNRRYLYDNSWHRGYNALHIDEYGYRVRDDTNNNGHWDSDRNGWLEPRTSDDYDRTGGGHNIHMGSVDGPLGSARVGGWSAGCQVIPGIANWRAFVYRAWTEMYDPVDYFLVDARDIPAAAWNPCTPDGSHGCPLPIELGVPVAGDTSLVETSDFDLYNCAAVDESGPEVVYAFTIDQSGTLSVTVDCAEPVDIDVHLLDGDDPQACLARGHTTFDYNITPGRYLIVADTFVGTSGEDLSGPYTLTMDLD